VVEPAVIAAGAALRRYGQHHVLGDAVSRMGAWLATEGAGWDALAFLRRSMP
jgi:hypothetical protein